MYNRSEYWEDAYIYELHDVWDNCLLNSFPSSYEKRRSYPDQDKPALAGSKLAFFEDESGPATILLENHVKITQPAMDAWGNAYKQTKHSSLDFLLVDTLGKPVCVLGATKDFI